MKLPIILYNIQNQKFSKTSIAKSNCLYFYSYINFNVKIVSGEGLLYNVRQIGTELITQNGTEFSGNSGYTLYIPKNKTSVVIEVSTGDSKSLYTFNLLIDNQIDETNEHYNDLLVNYNLPTFEQIKPALLEEYKDAELLKRLLLDFKQIIKAKGTKKSIENFFQFIGFMNSNLNIKDEYLNKNGAFTIEPNKIVDVKTGNYHVLYNNYIEEGFDANNLPVRKLVIEDLTKFFDKLLYAISLANTYFTLKEQNITFFGIIYSSNIAKEPGITSHSNTIIEHDVNQFRWNLKINLWTYIDSLHTNKKIENCLLKDNMLYRTEVKTFTENVPIFQSTLLYYVDREIFDDKIIDESDLESISRVFGTVVHLNIESPNTYAEFTFIDKINGTNRLEMQKQFVLNNKKVCFVVCSPSKYRLRVKITDLFGNVEEYTYEMELDSELNRISFESFNSSIVEMEGENIKNINLDLNSPSVSESQPPLSPTNYILPLDLIPNDLKDYYSIQLTDFVRWLSATSEFNLKPINSNFKLDDITESIPLDLVEPFLDIISFEFQPDWELFLKVYDINQCKDILIDFRNIATIDKTFDMLYVTLMDIVDRQTEISTPHYFIMTNQLGVDLTEQSFNFILKHKITGQEKSIYSMQIDSEIYRRKLPVNFDFPLFNIQSAIVPDFITFISPALSYKLININDTVPLAMITTLYPRLVAIDSGVENTYYLKLGDVILCRLDEKYVVGEVNLNWKIFNAFTNELLFESTDFMLKYRINEHTIYNVLCEFKIGTQINQIFKKSLFSSFVKESFNQ